MPFSADMVQPQDHSMIASEPGSGASTRAERVPPVSATAQVYARVFSFWRWVEPMLSHSIIHGRVRRAWTSSDGSYDYCAALKRTFQ
jgi:hypothetical protein